MTGLFQLSLEIRDEILHYVILLPIEPPATYEEFERQDREPTKYTGISSRKNRVLIEKRPQYGRDIKAVMLANRQLHREAALALERHARKPANCLLDVAYLTDVKFCATWLSVPILKPRIDTLVAQFRIVKAPLEAMFSPMAQLQYRLGCGGPPGIMRTFHAALETCLRGGPLGPERNKLEMAGDADCQFVRKHGMTVKNLVLDFLPVDETDGFLLAPNITRLTRSIRDYDVNKMISRASEAPCFFGGRLPGSPDATLSAGELLSGFCKR
jgi:hypothetical protein